MEPLSLAASIFETLEAAHKTLALIKKLINLRKTASKGVETLNQEISKTHLLIQNVDSMFVDRSNADNPPSLNDQGRKANLEKRGLVECLCENLGVVKIALLELEKVLHYQLLKADGSPDHFAWLRGEKKIKLLQRDLEKARQGLDQAIGALNLKHSQTIELVAIDTRSIALETNEMVRSLWRANLPSAPVATTPLSVASSPRESEADVKQALSDGKNCLTYPMSPVNAISPVRASYGMLAFRLAQRAECNRYCNCSCHQTQPWKLPGSLQPIFGMLCASYYGMPALPTRPHSDRRCKSDSKSGLHITYLCPKWIFARAISMTMLQGVGGIQTDFRVHYTRPDTDEAFRFAQDGNTEALKKLICSRRASVLDITNNNGHSLLHTALRYSRVATATYLIQEGAERHLENNHGETPHAQAWNNVFYFQNTERAAEFEVAKLLELFPDEEEAEERRSLTYLHRIVLGQQHGNLEKIAEENRAIIDKPDGEGKTALYWAAARGDVKAVEALLKFGADPNCRDDIGQGPLRASLKAIEPDCMKALLATEAEVDITDNWRQTCLIAAHYYPRPVQFVIHLLDHGADPDAADFRGDTALIKTVKGPGGGFATSASILLAADAELDKQNKAGHTVLHAAIMTNAHIVLKLLVSTHEPNFRLSSNIRESFLHLAATYGDTRTLKILSSIPWRYAPALDQQRYDGQTPLDLCDSRVASELDSAGDDEDRRQDVEDWKCAWEDLLESFNRTFAVRMSWSFINGHIKRTDTGSTDDPRSFHTAFSDFAPP